MISDSGTFVSQLRMPHFAKREKQAHPQQGGEKL